jgi:hypothetical protein
LRPPILADVCQRITGQNEYSVDFDNSGYNIGRLATLEFQDKKTFISFSEVEIRSRNSSFQSFPSALNRYILDENPNKDICFYFHPDTTGDWETPYFIFMYRLMRTANVNFLNGDQYLDTPITPFISPEDIILNKDQMRSRNPGNRSTYLTRGSRNQLQIFGKTYGANKYETTILCLAISEIATNYVELYEIEEGGLTKLPQISKTAIESLGVVQIFTSNRTIERIDFEENDSLRSAQYIYNLLEKLGNKKCALCNCGIPQVIQGAHIWPVADIKKEDQLTIEEKLTLALDGDNGLWLCNNHHKLFDINIIKLLKGKNIKCKANLPKNQINYLKEITVANELPENIMNESFTQYLTRRNKNIPEGDYISFTG